MNKNINPLTCMDYPDVDVIRVGDTYYMVSTTMYFFPGCEILRSHNLVDWEHAAFVYDRLDSTDAQRLVGKENAYGQGMWAASLRFHEGRFYVVFVANDTGKTYLYTADDIEGPWKKSLIEGFYHDNSLLFDDDGRVYIVYGNRGIYLTELNEDLTGPKEGGLHRLVVKDRDDAYLGYEGSHIYKIGGKYYIFFIHIPKATGRRTESCFVADSLEGEFKGIDVFDDDGGFFGSGIAQGGIVEVPSGKWYAILFRDNGAVGRIPFLIPVRFEYKAEFGCEFPVFGETRNSDEPCVSGDYEVEDDSGAGKKMDSGVGAYLPAEFTVEDLRPGYVYAPLYGADDFNDVGDSMDAGAFRSGSDCGSFGFKSFWQFNHEPSLELVERDGVSGSVKIRTGKISTNLVQAQNTLTQRALFPECSAEVTVDGTELKDGDYAGLCMLQSSYGFIGLTRRDGKLCIVMCNREIDVPGIWGERKDDEAPREVACVALEDVGSALRRKHAGTDAMDAASGVGHSGANATEASVVTLRADVDFTDMKDTVSFSYAVGALAGAGEETSMGRVLKSEEVVDSEMLNALRPLGEPHKLVFKLDHFTGARFGLFVYSTKAVGGSAKFSDFRYYAGDNR